MSLDLCAPNTPPPLIIRGENKVLTVALTDDKKVPIPGGVEGATEIIAIFKSTDPLVPLQKKLSTLGVSIINGPGGIFSIILAQADTLLLALSPTLADGSLGLSDIEVRYTIAGVLTIVQLTASIQVIDSLFPGV